MISSGVSSERLEVSSGVMVCASQFAAAACAASSEMVIVLTSASTEAAVASKTGAG